MPGRRWAGVKAVGLTTGNFTPESLTEAGAWVVMEAIEDILPLWEGATP